MKIGKGEMILAVVDLFDEIERLQTEAKNSYKPCTSSAPVSNVEQVTISETDKHMIKLGKDRCFDKSTYSWKDVYASRDGKSGETIVTKYEDWIKDFVRELPSFMSFDEFASYFASDLEAEYERRKQNAIAELAVQDDE